VPSPEQLRVLALVLPPVAAVLAIGAGTPLLLEAALPRFGVRGVAMPLLALAALSLVLPGRRLAGSLGPGAFPALGIPVLLLGAAATGEAAWLRLTPALVYLALAGVFLASLREEGSIIERTARLLVPEAPAFIRSYCRKLTGLWAGVFAASAAAIGALAVTGPADTWRQVTGGAVWAGMLGLAAVEFLIRKTWFRYYFHGGPFDRLWSSLFPAENTSRGRASAAYIRQVRAAREAGGRPPPQIP
jgi:uncharacterized membrane protein